MIFFFLISICHILSYLNGWKTGHRHKQFRYSHILSFFHLYSNIALALFSFDSFAIWISLNIQLCWFPIIFNSFIPHDSWWYLSWMFSQQLLLKVESGYSALKRQGWWKGKFALFWEWQPGGGELECCSKADYPQPCFTWQSVVKRFYSWKEGVTCRNSTVLSDILLEISHVVVWSVSSWFF